MNKSSWDSISSVCFDQHFSTPSSGRRVIAIVTSGYERRSSYWYSSAIKINARSRIEKTYVIGFAEMCDRLSRPSNDEFYQENGLQVDCVASTDTDAFVSYVGKALEQERGASGDAGVELHVDYSCMPRSWYCLLPSLLASLLEPRDTALLWYSRGRYHQVQQYPTAGVNDFRLFSGRPSLNPSHRVHIFGLGFDRIRSHAIWSVLEPKRLICFYADGGTREDYVKKAKMDNREILAASAFAFTVPLDDFVVAFSTIRSVVIDLRRQGDVILVPDGPKQSILACSLVPLTLDCEGVVCFHVRRRWDPDIGIVDVDGCEVPTGFMMKGRRGE